MEYLCLYLSASKYQRPPLLHQPIDQLVYSVDSQCSAIRIALAVALKYTVWSILLNFSHIFSQNTLKCSQMRCVLKVIKNALYYSISPQNALHCIKMHIAAIRWIALIWTRHYSALKCTVVCDFGGKHILRPPTVSMAVTNNYPPTPNWDWEQFWPKISHCTTQGSNCFRWSSIELRDSELGKKWSGNSSKVNLEQMRCSLKRWCLTPRLPPTNCMTLGH